MSLENTLLAENISLMSPATVYTERKKAGGYHLNDGFHTFVYQTENFTGSISLQGTLELYPGETDWVNVVETEFTGTEYTGSFSGNFSANFVWLRAGYQLESGNISQIRYSF